jgi:hypothetical protein
MYPQGGMRARKRAYSGAMSTATVSAKKVSAWSS